MKSRKAAIHSPPGFPTTKSSGGITSFHGFCPRLPWMICLPCRENHRKTAQSRVYSFIIFFPFQIAMEGSNGSSFRHAPGDIGPTWEQRKTEADRDMLVTVRHVSLWSKKYLQLRVYLAYSMGDPYTSGWVLVQRSTRFCIQRDPSCIKACKFKKNIAQICWQMGQHPQNLV